MGGKIDGVFIEDRRHAELSRVGIDFSLSFPDVAEIVFTDFNAPVLGSYPLFKNGILLTNDNDKGEVLVRFLKILAWKPTLIVFVDDRIEHLLAVARALQLYYPEITFIGLHFQTDRVNYEDTNVEHFSAKWREHVKKAKEILAKDEELSSE